MNKGHQPGGSGAPSHHQYHQNSSMKGASPGHMGPGDRQKNYNTIDANAQMNASIGAQNLMIAPGATGHGGPEARGTHATQETAGTSNPSNEVNANSEYIDIMRKIPRILCERYELLDVLGKGAHGRIYLATDLVTHDRVAIKLVSNNDA